MSYMKPSVTPLHVDHDSASCCTPLATVNLGRVVVGGGCNLPGTPRGIEGICVTAQAVGNVCVASTGG